MHESEKWECDFDLVCQRRMLCAAHLSRCGPQLQHHRHQRFDWHAFAHRLRLLRRDLQRQATERRGSLQLDNLQGPHKAAAIVRANVQGVGHCIHHAGLCQQLSQVEWPAGNARNGQGNSSQDGPGLSCCRRRCNGPACLHPHTYRVGVAPAILCATASRLCSAWATLMRRLARLRLRVSASSGLDTHDSASLVLLVRLPPRSRRLQ